MPDTGAPWNIPYVAGTDLVSDWPTDSQTLAEAVADALDVAGGLVAVEKVVKTDTFSASITTGSSAAITDLSISHALSDASNVLILLAQVVGASANFSPDVNPLAVFIAAGGTQINAPDSPGNRAPASAINFTTRQEYTNSVSLIETYAPASTSSITYTVNVRGQDGGTKTTYINRGVDDTDAVTRGRYISTFTLLEVRV